MCNEVHYSIIFSLPLKINALFILKSTRHEIISGTYISSGSNTRKLMMTKLIFLLVTLVLQYGICSGAGVAAGTNGASITADDGTSHGKDECEDCSMSLDSSVKTVSNILAGLEPILLTNPKLCRKCEFRGAKSIVRYGDACTKSVDGKPNTKDHTVGLEWKNMTLTCYCKLPTNPALVAQKVIERLNEGFKPCLNPPTKLDQSARLKGITKTVIDPKNILGLKSCKPLSLLSGPAETQEGKIVSYWPNVRLSITMRVTDEEEFEITDGELLNFNFNEIVSKCQGDKSFNSSCQCVLDSKFLITALGQIVDLLIPCYIDGKNEKVEELVKHLICQE